MTRSDYGIAYERGYNLTVGFLISRGLYGDAAEETAQAAWARGWERREQLRNDDMVLTWVNSIALNLYRSAKRKPLLQVLPELTAPPRVNLAGIDADRVLKFCRAADRLVLRQRYLEDCQIKDIAQQQGWTETAVRIRLVRARRAAKKRIADTYLTLRAPFVAARRLQAVGDSAAA
jgi:DNA-directed RNA polymerase specialized sigma24 family protein